ncbi:MAG: hypothetical protein ACKVS9_01505 [Phycisphaerae bacterium]
MRRKLLATCVLIGGICFQSTCTVTGSSGSGGVPAGLSSGLPGGLPGILSGGGIPSSIPNYGTPLTQTAPPSAFTGGRGGGSAGGFGFSFGSP